MASTPHDLLEQLRTRRRASIRQSTRQGSGAAYPTPPPAAPSRSSESWVDVPSRDSSTSLSSAADEIITHGLRVGNSEPQYRRRHTLSNHRPHASMNNERAASVAGSSQDEYTESESEPDPMLTSSSEAVSADQSSKEHSRERSDTATIDDEEQDDENATTLGTRNANATTFTPQPNAFSHPPLSQASRLDHAPGSYFPLNRPSSSKTTGSRRASFPAQHGRRTHSPYNAISPSHQPDHDAALRASLNTLLACATAARGLPKSEPPKDIKATKAPMPANYPRPKYGSTRIEPSSLRIISGPPKPLSNSSHLRQPSSSPSRRSDSSDKGKRKASRSNSKERRASKRLRSVGTDELISPTLLTWVVSASVLVLVSALSFSAGVSVGKEAERLQANGWPGPETLSDGTKRGSRSGLGLRRRLFSGAVRAVAA